MTVSPRLSAALLALGLCAAPLHHSWNDRFSSSIGYSMVDIDNASSSDPAAFKRGHYALGNFSQQWGGNQ